jgi:hypothetical protein
LHLSWVARSGRGVACSLDLSLAAAGLTIAARDSRDSRDSATQLGAMMRQEDGNSCLGSVLGSVHVVHD